MQAILISGKQGSGKTTLVAGLTQELLKSKIVPFSLKFADPLYMLHDVVYASLAPYGIQKPAVKDGELLQLLGTEWGRKKFGPHVWANIAQKRIVDMQAQLEKSYKEQGVLDQVKDWSRIALIDDLRFPEEFDAFGNGLKVRLEAPEEVRKVRAEYWRKNSTHSSETALDQHVKDGKFNQVFDAEALSAAQILKLTIDSIKEHICKSTTPSSELSPPPTPKS